MKWHVNSLDRDGILLVWGRESDIMIVYQIFTMSKEWRTDHSIYQVPVSENIR